MIVSWNWLKDYVEVGAPVDAVTEKLTMSGLNLEETTQVGDDFAIDLEVTSNRPDCLGHIGVAREVSVLFNHELTIPSAQLNTVSQKTADLTAVDIECEDLCPRYYARVIRGVKVAPSPKWLVDRLATVGIDSINNIVDITNYVLMECGQPLHAFDFDKLHGQKIVVRRATAGEKLQAINQKEYTLTPDMCVIADADHPVAIGGVMGGFETEIGNATVNVLIETADFQPLSIRNTARALNLHSDSSYRFERGIDATQLDWASRRCCELILQLAGGELLDEPVIAGTPAQEPTTPIHLRLDRISRLLGIDIPHSESVHILKTLGLTQLGAVAENASQFIAPAWRRDLTREADLIEEVARIHGYDQIPENVAVPLQLSQKTHFDRVAERIRNVLIAAGFYETVTLSFITEQLFGLFQPRGDLAPLKVDHSSRRHENILRQSLVPNLLQVRRENERYGTFNAQLFELSRVYLRNAPGDATAEPRMLSFVSGRSFREFKGIIETLADAINHASAVTVRPSDIPQFVEGRGAEVFLNGTHWGWLGELDRSVTDKLDLRDTVVVAELDLGLLERSANLVPAYQEIAKFPAVTRDLNFILDENATWSQLEEVVRSAGGPLLESVQFVDQYRGKPIAADKKSYVLQVHYQSPERTLTSDEVEGLQSTVIAACREQLSAELR